MFTTILKWAGIVAAVLFGGLIALAILGALIGPTQSTEPEPSPMDTPAATETPAQPPATAPSSPAPAPTHTTTPTPPAEPPRSPAVPASTPPAEPRPTVDPAAAENKRVNTELMKAFGLKRTWQEACRTAPEGWPCRVSGVTASPGGVVTVAIHEADREEAARAVRMLAMVLPEGYHAVQVTDSSGTLLASS